MKVVETASGTTYTGEDATNLLNELKAKYGKKDASENTSEEEPDNKSKDEKGEKSQDGYEDPFAKIAQQLDNETQSEVDNVITQQDQQENGGGPPYYYMVNATILKLTFILEYWLIKQQINLE
ncbi:MAG: hypothetical protein WDO19_21935 [Bacteroidota bacterium]